MVTERLEVRLDEELRQWIIRIAEERGDTVSSVVRELLERGREEVMRERRHQAVEAIRAMEIEEMPDPEELARQMDSMYDVDLP